MHEDQSFKTYDGALTTQEAQARTKICLPLDGLETLQDAELRVVELSPVVGLFKVGKESYTRFGPAVVEMVQRHDADVFLDLKYKDIPTTMRGAAKAVTQLGVKMFNVHASAGSEALEATMEGVDQGTSKYGVQRPDVLGVTVLTSIKQDRLNGELNVLGPLDQHVLRLANLTKDAGLDGIVCSAQELALVRPYMPSDFIYVTPGIKGPRTPAGTDQARVMTPGRAVRDGASILVVGRAITAHETPEERQQAGYDILQDIVPYLSH